MARTDAERLAEELLPGWTAVGSTEDVRPTEGEITAAAFQDSREAEPDAVMPTLDDLRAKYLGAAAQDGGRDVVDPGVDEDTVLVDMRNGPLEKTVAISKSQRKIAWSQG